MLSVSQLPALPGITAACTALWTWRPMTSAGYSTARYLHEGCLMDTLDPASPIAAAVETASEPAPRVWKFWGTTFWGFVVFVAMFVGQLAVVGWFLFRQGGSIDQESFSEAVTTVVSNGLTISLSVITGLPAVLAALWIAIRIKRARFADYLALRSFSWTDLAIGVVALFVLVMAWDALSRA